MSNKRILKQQRTKARILQAARELAQENGFENLSLRAIARRVDYSPASLYEYFPNKDAIIDAVCEDTDAKIAASMQFDTNDITEITCRYIEFALKYPDDFQLLYRRPMLPEQEEKVPAIFSDSMKRMTQSTAHEMQYQEIAFTLWSFAHGIAILAINREDTIDSSFDYRKAITQFISSYTIED